MSLADYLRRVRETYYRCRKTVHILMRRLKRRAGNANMEMRPVIPRPRRWTRSYVQNGLKHAREGVSGFRFRRSRWRLASGNTPARRDRRVAPQCAIHVSRSIHRQTTSSIDVPTVNHTSQASTIGTQSIPSNPHDVNPSTVTPPRNSTGGTIQLTARPLNSPSIDSEIRLRAADSRFRPAHLLLPDPPSPLSIPQFTSTNEHLIPGTQFEARNGSSTPSELSPMNRMFVANLPPFSPDSGTYIQSSIPSGTTVQSFEGPKSSSCGGPMHIFPIDKADDIYNKLPFPNYISFSAEVNNDVAEISVTTSECS